MVPVRLGQVTQLVFVGIERTRGNFVQQRLPQMRMVDVDECHGNVVAAGIAVAERGDEFETAGTPADHDNTEWLGKVHDNWRTP